MIFRDVADVVRSLPTEMGNALDRLVQSFHSPVEIHDHEGKLTELLCRTCKTSWPCDEQLAAYDRITARRGNPRDVDS